MAVSADELSAPLGQKPARKRRFRLPLSGTQATAGVLALVLLGFAGTAIFYKDPMGGEPITRVAIKPPETAAQKPTTPTVDVRHGSADAAKVATDAPGQKTITIIDGSSGERQNVIVAADGSERGASEAAPSMMAGIDQKLLEQSRYGMVPIATGALKPVNVYAAGSDADRAKAMKTPSIAIVIGGLGVGAAKTNEAIMKLPPAVTLAFTPYGSDPAKLVERARAQRHEVLLQLPMEPFDYPDNDPGPQTLLASATPEQNIDRMMWHMSRFQGYVGVGNFMGARFIATDTAMQAVAKEASKRGLALFDDGSSSRSAAPAAAEGLGLPFMRADLTIDATPSSAEIDKALSRLEGLAKERGYAVGAASSLPISIEKLAAWAKTLESRGIMLVPLTTAILKSKSS
ncbi:divergent polysaccharide deacetylase family protein [Tardiphaga alba]|uniref:Divergent polysaccharide deacetylase family protein n=1 Tax=Tardiphaga alba TaxID=340268 RepID=A0ABX8A283_9BRAD|nr:divergent polysaccharide deacetylase family protein [Tardiphaga alba]QUS37513.1 divergent polysaccharide deacetylase family protein [Tardiphaga alba]